MPGSSRTGLRARSPAWQARRARGAIRAGLCSLDEQGGHSELGGADTHGHGGADAHGHYHSTSKAPWLILLPVLVLLLVAPPALGADAVARNAT